MNKLPCKTGIVNRLRSLFFLLAFAVFVLAYGQETKPAHVGEFMYDTDLPGSDIEHFTLDAPPEGTLDLRVDQCAQACWQNEDCVAWTFVKPNTIQGPKANCWLKNSVPAKIDNKSCISGILAELNTDRPGGDYSHFDNVNGSDVSARICQNICQSQDKCKAWTFVKPNTIQGPKGVCWLKDIIPPPIENSCCTSGYFDTETIR